jgi:lysophospholipase L1-like esterase
MAKSVEDRITGRRTRRTRNQAWSVMVCGLLAGLDAAAQPIGIVENPCPSESVPSAAFGKLVTELLVEPHTITAEELERFNDSPELAEVVAANRLYAVQDWPGLCRFRSANARVLSRSSSPRVVFMGDSITENWQLADPEFFDGRVVNRGISGQTTAQMLVRFRADVVALRPRIVHILAGTNDVAGNTGPMTTQDFENNIMSMVDLAQANGITVVVASIPPAASFTWRPEVKPVPTITALNEWLREYCAQQDIRYVDYYSALAGSAGEFPAELSNDGVHPNLNGYAIMRRLAEDALSTRRR